ncbi:hypothetical protein Ppa06_35230 [Planomonospora parontospora subsp. parontospora]|uniref:DUF2812 domain-containing protein n=2 Tax=Planomonospora parontospora TaxID=58119 RepID=A0AA37F4Y1_9ACTN|nr:hypothetical protein [Planomonospora parontospora]GGK71041.1 hypothetical protein GCM10010126_33230 [Planomonospora parontospora]GII09725.1 hypothetical protein Ppa06_35230 [Planomonospora parontospora subsp. parontospora]
MTTAYFDQLAGHLRGHGIPEEEIITTVDDLAAYAAESGADPEEEFGPAAGFAATLAPAAQETAPEGGPDPAAETWVWTADAFRDREYLNRYGEQGWEVERIDHLGRFVSRRDPERPLRWEYRRETVLPAKHGALAERLAPDGWEPCGGWMYFQYFKRPKAVSEGLAGELDDAPATPARRVFFGRRFYAFMVVWVLYMAALITGIVLGVGPLSGGDHEFGPDFVGGVLAGIAVVVLLVLITLRRRRRR